MSANPIGTLATNPGQSGTQVGIGFVDLMMNQMIMEQLKSINSTGGFTASTIITLILIMSLTELKSSAGEFIRLIVAKIKEYIPYYGTIIYENIKWISHLMFGKFLIYVWTNLKKFKNIFKKKSVELKSAQDKKDDSFTYSISWIPRIQQAI